LLKQLQLQANRAFVGLLGRNPTDHSFGDTLIPVAINQCTKYWYCPFHLGLLAWFKPGFLPNRLRLVENLSPDVLRGVLNCIVELLLHESGVVPSVEGLSCLITNDNAFPSKTLCSFISLISRLIVFNSA
jgi:hypothetical protein